jgi:hypothetical protein
MPDWAGPFGAAVLESFRLYPDAYEGGGSWVTARREQRDYVRAGHAANASRSTQESAWGARTTARRYIVANSCDKMTTLTYAVACDDRDRFVADMRAFWLDLRAALGGKPLPYLWVPEWHKSHGLHAHAAVADYIPFTLIREVWGRGRVRIERMSGAPAGHSRAVTVRARACARYVSMYVGKALDDERRVLGRHRYDGAQGFRPREIVFTARARDGALGQACEQWGARAETVWFSPEDATYSAMWASWRAAR